MTEDVLRMPSSVPEGERPEISLHLLVKNGESVVGRLLDCVGPHVSEVVAVLDYCVDDTGGILTQKAAEHGLRRCELVEVSPWSHPDLYMLDVPETYSEGRSLCGEELPGPHTGKVMLADFAAARNEGWHRCLGEWRLFLDADDVVDDPACLPGLCRALEGRGVDAASSRYHHGGRAGGSRERLARNHPDIRWQGAAHERLVGMDVGRVAHVEGSLVVRDLMDSRGEGTRVPHRNLKILYREARASDWQISSRQMAYLASEARVAMPEFARHLAVLCVEKSEWPEERAWACSTRGMVAQDAGDHEGAATWFQRALGLYPTRAAALRLCRACFHLRWWGEAVAAHERAARIPAEAQHLGVEDEDEDAARILAAASLSELGRDEEALALAAEARSSHPGSSGLARLASEIEARARGRGGEHV